MLNNNNIPHCAEVRRDMVLHQAFRARHLRTTGFGGEVRHGVTSGVSRETSLNYAFAQSNAHTNSNDTFK